MIKYSDIPKTFATEFDRNNAIKAWVDSLSIGYTFTDEERFFAMQYSGKGQEFSKEKGLVAEGLYEFYTPAYLRKLMWDLAKANGYTNGPVLEPSCATGHMFLEAPSAALTGIELNPTTARIAQASFKNADIHNIHFEQVFMDEGRGRWNSLLRKPKVTWLKHYPFDLVIGNPPYGKHSNMYSGFFKKNYIQVEIFFLLKSLELLKTGGLVVFLTASSWLRNGHLYQTLKDECSRLGTLVDAYRNPTVFNRSSVPTDILVYKRK